jgi:hypothetical protein
MTTYQSYPFLNKRKTFVTYRCCTCSRWQNTLNPVVSSNDMTYKTWLAYLQKTTIYIYTHTSPLIPSSGARTFNAARIALYMWQECIHVLQKRPQNIPRPPYPRCVGVASRMTDTQPLPHDRDYHQESLILRGWVQDSHHPVGGHLPSYLVVGASL